METLILQDRYAPLLWQQGLRSVSDFVTYPEGVNVGSHPTRDVSFVQFPGLVGFLKRQFRLPWKDYFASWWASTGWVCKSMREWRLLHALREYGIGCPEPVAVGDNGRQAFLFVKALPESADLLTFLTCQRDRTTRQRVLKRISRTLCKM